MITRTRCLISSLCFVCKNSIIGTESLGDHMATVESSFMNTINSFIHGGGCTVTGLLSIVYLLECGSVRLLWPSKQIHQFKLKILLNDTNNQVDNDPFD